MTRKDVIDLLLKKRDPEETSLRFAERIGISPQYLNDIWHGRRDPGPKVLKFLGLRKGYEIGK